MKRREQIVITTLMVATLMMPLILMGAGVRPNVDENRELAAAPELAPENLTNDATWSQLGDYLTDRFPMRDHAIEADADLRERFNFAEAAREGIPRGKNGWLYHHDTLLDRCTGPPTHALFNKGDKIPERAERVGTEFLMVVIPDKVVVYPQHQASEGLTGILGLEGDEALPPCEQAWVDALDAESPSRGWLWNLGPELVEAANDTDEHLYYELDTHWTNQGALRLVEGLVERLAPGTYERSEVKPSGEIRAGDLARLKGSSEREARPGLVITRPGVTVREGDLSADEERSMQVVSSTAESTGAPLIEGTTVVLGDSFTAAALPLLVPYFEEIVFLQRTYLLEHTIGEALEGRVADRIIIAEIQRNVAKGWYTDLMEAANRHLVHEQD